MEFPKIPTFQIVDSEESKMKKSENVKHLLKLSNLIEDYKKQEVQAFLVFKTVQKSKSSNGADVRIEDSKTFANFKGLPSQTVQKTSIFDFQTFCHKKTNK
jgi:hypothetical protein